jgi:hypothetical protein
VRDVVNAALGGRLEIASGTFIAATLHVTGS